jgi:WD40 repeat protein
VFITEGPEETGIIDIRDARTGRTVRKFKGHDVDVNHVAFSDDGSMLATTGDDGVVKVWDPSTGKLLSSVSGKGSAWGPSFTADGSLLSASWPDEGKVRIVDPSTGRVIRTISGLQGGPLSTDLSPNGKRLAVGNAFIDDAFVFDVGSGKQVFDLRGHLYPVNQISWSSDARHIATASNDASVRVWDGNTGRHEFTLFGHTGSAITADWSPDDPRLVTAGSDGTAKVWEVSEGGGRELVTLSAQETRSGTFAAFSPDGTHVITGAADITAVKIWDVSLGGAAEWANFPTDSLTLVDTAFMPDGRVVSGIRRGSVAVWDVNTRRQIRTIGPGRGPPEPVVVIRVSPDGSRIATVRNFSNVASVWDTRTGKSVFEIEHTGEVSAVDWSSDGTRLVISSFDGSARVFDRSGREIREIREKGFEVLAARFSPDGRFLATSAVEPRTARGRATIRDWQSGRIVRTIQQPRPIQAIAFDPKGSRIATAHAAGFAEVWDLRSGRSVARLAGHSGSVDDIAFSPDGSRIATAGDDGTVRLFDAETGNQLVILRGHEYSVFGISFSPDGNRLASAGADGVVRIWALDLDDLIRIAKQEVTRGLTDEECRQYLHVDRCPRD